MKSETISIENNKGELQSFGVKKGRFVSIAPVPHQDGRNVLPGFVDAHCHILPMGLDLQKLHLGSCSSKSDVLEAVAAWASAHPEGWLHAVHYDQTKFADCQHLTSDELDRVTAGRPVLLRHSNGHASVANSAALLAANVTDSTVDPPGGTFVRDESGRLTGVLLERAHELVTNASPAPTYQEMVDAILVAGEKMAALGITCATDMMTGRWNLAEELAAYRDASQRGCAVRLRLYAQWATVLGSRGIEPDKLKELTSGMDKSRCELKGLKIFADGAIGSATAAIYGSYVTTGGQGQLIYAEERLKSMVQQADEAGWSVAVHSIGDRSTDLVIEAFENTFDPKRHRIEHAMILSDDQIKRLAKLGCQVTMQPEFLKRFGHAYVKQLGPQVASKLKRFKSVLDAGIPLSFSSDRPIVPGDPWDGIDVAVERPEGFDALENITIKTAVRLYTEASAIANGDAGNMGVIAEEANADYQVYKDRVLESVFCGGHQTYLHTNSAG